jgi:hypothetical protein
MILGLHDTSGSDRIAIELLRQAEEGQTVPVSGKGSPGGLKKWKRIAKLEMLSR